MTATINIPANDNPYGTVQFVGVNYHAREGENSSFVELNVQRYGGMFGDLKVFYR